MIRRFITVAASLALMLSCLTPVQLFAADTDSQSKFSERQINEKSYIFANGNDVVIAQDSDGKTYAALKGDTNDRKEVDENTYLFAGSENDNASYEAVTIEMESGVIGTIVGSNKGTGNITTSNIVINGGSIGMAIGNQGSSKKEAASGGGAASYADRKTHTVNTVNIIMNAGSAQALVPGSYGYTYVGQANVTVNGGNIAATTNPMQAGVLGGTNGEIENLTINFNGGTTKDIALSQRAMITGKAIVNVNGGSVGDIYAGSYYDDNDNATGTNSWNGWRSGDVNYGQAKDIDIRIDNAAYNNIFAGFQYVDKALFLNKYGNWISTIDGSETAPLSIYMNSEPTLQRGAATQHAVSVFDLKGNFVDVPVTSIALDKTRLTLQTGEMASLQATIAPKLAKDTELVWSSSDPTVAAFSKEDPIRIRALRPGTVTITVTAGAVSASCEVTVNKVTAVVPPFDTSKPTDTVEAGLNDEAVTNTINQTISSLTEKILTGKETGMVDAATAEKIKAGLDEGKALTVEAIVQTMEVSKINKEDAVQVGTAIEQLSAKNNSSTGIAQYLDLRIAIKVGGTVVGDIKEVTSPLTYSIRIPEDMIKEGRSFHIVRIHNNKAEILPIRQSENIISFDTDKFSTYALVYEDKKVEDAGTVPNPSPDTESPDPTPEKVMYTVVFVDHNGSVLKVEKVEAGQGATALQAPERKGYRFVKWDTDFSTVTKDLLVKPVYEKVTESNGAESKDAKDSTLKASPDTGDNTGTGLFAGFALLGLVSMAIVAVARKRNRLTK